jgi:hypothetical protein
MENRYWMTGVFAVPNLIALHQILLKKREREREKERKRNLQLLLQAGRYIPEKA